MTINRAPAASVDEPTKPLAAPIGGSTGLATPPAGAVSSLTLERLAQLAPHCKDRAEILTALESCAPHYGLQSPAALAMWLAQFGHESMGFTRRLESFSFTPERLLVVFPRKFQTLALAQRYFTRGPQAIASYVYADRLGNGPEESGDGWRYRGHGYPQLTGKANFARYGHHVGVDLVAQPERAAEVTLGVQIACSFFRHSGALEFAERGDLSGCTRRINGGHNGLIDRARRWEAAKRVLQVAA